MRVNSGVADQIGWAGWAPGLPGCRSVMQGFLWLVWAFLSASISSSSFHHALVQKSVISWDEA